MRQAGKIDYVELAAADLESTKAFYSKAFGWAFEDYGPAYAAWNGAGLDGGIASEPSENRPPLVILYADDLEAMLARVEAAGGSVTRPIFSFPGGRRFQFVDPGGNEMGVWSLV